MIALVTGPQLRGARAMAGLGQRELAARAGVAHHTVKRLEGMGRLRATLATIENLQRALEAAGIEFIDGGGVKARAAA